MILTYCHHEVDQGHSVEGDVPPIHQAAQVDDDEDNDDQIDDAGYQIEAHQNECDNENCCQRYSKRLERVLQKWSNFT